ncbi:MAG: hypothetical protein HETSPECPRED_010032 [Heterodermia speciosa]|uniref:Uncharacterized protein n=1 Tax=Heterodermia speciosa TaxID=116794 RepID=A0A8H3GAK9_9LECA|nr:MAG: hypothetical protein HETSPECPRED_010032 [Heterodermia speciosa]
MIKDLVTYKLEIKGSNIFIDEGIRAGLYGSGILNNKFLERFRSFMELNNISSIPRGQRREATATSRPAIESEAMKEFEKKKRSFGDDQDKKLSRPMFIRIPGLEDRYDRLQRPLGFGGIDIPRTIIMGLFDDILYEILGMLKEQVFAFNETVGNSSESRLQRIMLVGGFSENEYVYESITNACSGLGSFAGYDIQVTRPNEPSATLISRGALLRALHNPVGQRILAQSYGFKRDEEYHHELHGSARSCPDYHEGYLAVQDRISWLCKANDKIDRDRRNTFRIRGYRYIPVTGPASISESLYRSYTETRDHVRYNAPGIQEVGQLKMDFSLIDRQDFRIRTITRDGTAEEVALIDYEVQLIFDGIRLTYRLIVPELGQWWNWDGKTESQHDVQWGKNPYHAEATIENVAAAYDFGLEPAGSSSTPASKHPISVDPASQTKIDDSGFTKFGCFYQSHLQSNEDP